MGLRPLLATPRRLITFTDDTTQEFNWSGAISQETMAEAGLFSTEFFGWLKPLKTVELGYGITSINEETFSVSNTL